MVTDKHAHARVGGNFPNQERFLCKYLAATLRVRTTRARTRFLYEHISDPRRERHAHAAGIEHAARHQAQHEAGPSSAAQATAAAAAALPAHDDKPAIALLKRVFAAGVQWLRVPSAATSNVLTVS